MSKDLKRLLSHSSIYMVGNLLNRLGAFLLLPLYTNYLSTSEYGVLEIIYATNSLIATVLGAGLAHATLRFYFDYDEKKKQLSVITTNFYTALLITSTGAMIIVAANSPISLFLMGDTAYANAISIAVAIMVLEATAEVGFAYLRACEKSVVFVVLSLLKLLAQVGASIYFVAHLTLGVEGVLYGNFVSVVLIWLVVTTYVFKACGFGFDRVIIKPILKYSIPFVTSGVIAIFTLNSTLYILRSFSGLGTVGLYGLALKFAMILRFILSEPFQRSYGPFRFSIIKQDNAKHIQSLALHYFVVAASLTALGIALYTPAVLSFMAAEEFWSATEIVPLILMAYLFNGILYCFQTGILYKKKTKYLIRISLTSSIISVTCSLALIPVLGVFGAASALLISSFFSMILTNKYSQSVYHVMYDYIAIIKLISIMVLIFLFARASTAGVTDLLGNLLTNTFFICLFIIAVLLTDAKSRAALSKISEYIRKRKLRQPADG